MQNLKTPTSNRGDVGCEDLSLPLTDEQCGIVLQPPAERILVTAGPGTGKTHVLIARIEALIRFYGVQPGRELLVLSFARATVYELKKRLRSVGGDARYVNAYTFDSFATRLLSRFDPNGNWDMKDYDARIEDACRVIRREKEAQEALSGYVNILVDEVQDLVGVRAEFVQELLHQSNAGFTLLGDPAQGIYNFQLDDEQERRIGSRALYNALQNRYGSLLQRRVLNKNHRAKSKWAEVPLLLGRALSGDKPNYDQIADLLITISERLPSLGSIDNAANTLGDLSGSTAILTRTNGQALIISRELSAKGITHIVRQRASDRIIAPWVGRVFNTLSYLNIGKSQFFRFVESRLNGDGPEPKVAWDLLKRIEGKGGEQLDITVLAQRIGMGYVPDELTQTPAAPLIVSTIHRAKGLEFDNIVLVEPEDIRSSTWLEEETRTLFVALTRAKYGYYRITPPTEYGLHKSDHGRWFVRHDGWRTKSVEICGDDIHHMDPAGTYLVKDDPQRLQDYIYHEVRSGDPVTIALLKGDTGHKPHAYYQIKHNGVVIGITDESFSYILHSILKVSARWKVQRWPSGFGDVYVQGIDTVAGSKAAGRRAGMDSGIWLRVRVAGLGRIRWN